MKSNYGSFLPFQDADDNEGEDDDDDDDDDDEFDAKKVKENELTGGDFHFRRFQYALDSEDENDAGTTNPPANSINNDKKSSSKNGDDSKRDS